MGAVLAKCNTLRGLRLSTCIRGVKTYQVDNEAPRMNTEHRTEGPHVELLTVRAVAQMLALSRTSVLRGVHAGRIPAHMKIGRACRWRRSELLAWLDAGAPPMGLWHWPLVQGRALPHGQKEGES